VHVSGFKALPGVSVAHFSNTDKVQLSYLCGETGNRYQGWISTGYLKAEPAPVVGFTGCAIGDFIAVTVLQIDPGGGQEDTVMKNNLLSDIGYLDWAPKTIAELKRIVMKRG
jgi:hypothetical protein